MPTGRRSQVTDVRLAWTDGGLTIVVESGPRVDRVMIPADSKASVVLARWLAGAKRGGVPADLGKTKELRPDEAAAPFLCY